MRSLFLLLAVAVPLATASASFLRAEPQYYGPLLTLAGVGYKESIEKDGAWRIVTNSRRSDGEGYALNMALYRAAELAHEGGFTRVQILGGYSTRMTGVGVLSGTEFAKIFARGSNSAGQPEGCRSHKPNACYSASVAEILFILGPAVGRAGAVRPVGVPLPIRAPSAPLPVDRGPRTGPVPLPPAHIAPTQAQDYAARLKAAQPARGRDAKQGWTVSD